jgi:hypothetical protein
VRSSFNVVALLESMWGWRGYNEPGEDAPVFFRINRDNFSGKRLYRMCGDANLLVTNSCRTVQESASHHGVPDPEWVGRNLAFLAKQGMDLLLVCGQVAKRTYIERPCGWNAHYPNVLFIDHPAARRWTNARLDEITSQISAIALRKGSL